MPPKTIKMAIVDILDDLLEDNLEKFRHQLLDRREEPTIRRNRVDGKSRLQIADVLVSTFMEPRAAQVSVEILRQINCNDEAERLAQETGVWSSKPGSTDTVRPSAGETGAEGDCAGEHFVDKHFAELVARVSEIASILDELLNKKVMTQGMYDEISVIPTNSAKMRKLYSGPLKAAGRDGKDVFYKLLEKYEKYLMDELKKNK